MSKMSGLFASIAAAALSLALVGGPASAGEIVGLVTKTNTNPFFVKMKEGFEKKAKEVGLTPQAYAGKFDGDNDGEVRAIEQLIAAARTRLGKLGLRRFIRVMREAQTSPQ